MAHLPPHKRHSLRHPPNSEFLAPQLKGDRNWRSQTSYDRSRKRIVYANSAIYRWFAVGFSDDGQLPSRIHLKSVHVESNELRSGEEHRVLVNSHLTEETTELREDDLQSPWAIIAENVKQDLLTSFERLRNKMQSGHLELVKPTLVARVCKIIFHGNPLVNAKGDQSDESVLKRLKRSVYTNVPDSYMDYVKDEVVPKLGFTFEDEKDIYHVRLSDNTRPDTVLSCKCSVQPDKKLLPYKVELNQVRQMVTDIACLDKNLDIRLMLRAKRILKALTDEEVENIRLIVNSAIVDSNVNGGLRWPSGTEGFGNRFRVVGVWHTNAKAYFSPSLRLKVRRAHRYDFVTGKEEDMAEVFLKLKGFVSELQEKRGESDADFSMFKDNLRLIWEHFLRCEPIF